MKAYKGFEKDMTCRGFQFKEGETYHEDEAKLCKSGFHACENPLDCFKYYNPAKSVYREVELDDVGSEASSDSKICAKTIKIGAELDVLGICKAHFEYIKSKAKKEEHAQDGSSLAARSYSSLAAQDGSSLAARSYSSLAAQDDSSLAAQDCSSLAAQDDSSLAARSYSSLAARSYSSLAARSCSSLAARSYSSLAARNYSSLAARSYSSLAAQDDSSLAAQDCSSLAAQDCSSLSAGKNSVIAAFNSKAKGDIGTLVALANRIYKNGEWKIIDFKAGIVDGEKIKADVWYKLQNGEFVECEEE